MDPPGHSPGRNGWTGQAGESGGAAGKEHGVALPASQLPQGTPIAWRGGGGARQGAAPAPPGAPAGQPVGPTASANGSASPAMPVKESTGPALLANQSTSPATPINGSHGRNAMPTTESNQVGLEMPAMGAKGPFEPHPAFEEAATVEAVEGSTEGQAPPASDPPQKRRSILRKLGAVFDTGLLRFFGAIAKFVALHPVAVLVGAILLAALLGAGNARLTSEDDFNKLYTPAGSEAFVDQTYVYSMYPQQPQDVRIYMVVSDSGSSPSESLLSKSAMLLMMGVYEQLEGINKGQNASLASVCYRPGGAATTACDGASVLDYWGRNRTLLEADPDVLATINRGNATTGLGDPVLVEDVIGGVARASSGAISAARALQTTLWLQQGPAADTWQEAAVSLVKMKLAKLTSPGGDVTVSVFIYSNWDYNKTANDATYGDLPLLLCGFALILVYGFIMLFKPHPVLSRSGITIANIASILLTCISAIGLCSLFGVPFSLVGQVLPLLLLGLGTDDMLVTMAADDEVGREMPHLSVVDRIVAAVSRARRGIIVATLTNFVAFCTGIISTLPALRDFMIYAAVGVVCLLVYQSTFFVACLTLDTHRQRKNRWDVLCCLTSKAGPTDGCCRTKYNPESTSLVKKAVGSFLPRIILHPLGKVTIALLTAGLAVMGVLGAIGIEEDFHPDFFVPSSTYVGEVITLRDATFTVKGVSYVGVYTKNTATPPLDFFSHQKDLQQLALAFDPSKDALVGPTTLHAWYPAYVAWLPSSPFATALVNGSAPNATFFYTSLRSFLAAPQGVRYQEDIVWGGTASSPIILSSRYTFFTVRLKDSKAQVDAMGHFRAKASESTPSLGAVAYGDDFIAFEGYAAIEEETILAVGIASGVVFIIMLVMLADLTAAILVGIMVGLINLELIGFIYWFGLTFNMVTSICLLLAIGIAVDYSAFIAFSFMGKTGTRNERAAKALEHLGEAVFNGGLIMFFAVALTALAQSYVFQTFFKMFAMIVTLGLWHGLFALPVALSLIGARPYDSAYDGASRSAATSASASMGSFELDMDPKVVQSAPPVVSMA